MRYNNTSKSLTLSAFLHITIFVIIYQFATKQYPIPQKTTVFLSSIQSEKTVSDTTKEPPKTQNQNTAQNSKQNKPELENITPAQTDIGRPNMGVAKEDTNKTNSSPKTNTEAISTKESGKIEPKITKPIFNASYLHNPPPDYPASSKKLGEEGIVYIRALISIDGSCKKAEIKRSSGYGKLDGSAIDTVRSWRFVPAKKGEEPIEEWVEIPIEFRR